ncbi:MAG: YqjK-like family protein [Gallionella sp.]|nr:YqjK-like family protein [Gallionella sp.]
MNKQMLAVMQRRGELLARIAVQREQVAATALRWQTPLALADKGLAVVRFLRSNPVLVAGVLAVAVLRRRGMTGMLAVGWRAWRLYQSARAFSAKVAVQTRH